MTLYILIQYASALFAFVAAALWWKSAIVRTPKKFGIHVVEVSGLSSQPVGTKYVGYGYSKELTELGEALVRQSRWNSWGARSAAVAALLQTTTIFIQP